MTLAALPSVEIPTRTVLIYRLGSLGDTVVALPIFNRIAERYPAHRRLVLTNLPVTSAAPTLLSVLGTGKSVHGALTYPVGTRDIGVLRDLRLRIRATGARELVYAMPTRPAAGMWRDLAFLALCGIRCFVGVPVSRDLREVRIDPKTSVEEPEVERLARALSPLGPFDLGDPTLWDLRLDAEEQFAASAVTAPLAGREVVAVNMGGKQAGRDWGEANWAALLDRLALVAADWGLLVVGGADDAARAARLVTRWPGPAVDACGRLAPRETAAALGGARVFIGHDSGPLHLASAVGVSSIGLFGDQNRPRRWHPYLGNNRIIHEQRGIAAISVDRVARTFDDLRGDHVERA